MIPHPLRNWSRSSLAILAMCVTLAGLSACNRSSDKVPPQTAPAPQAAAFRVTSVDVGNAIGADRKVTAPSESFKPSDTIYASVSTDGAASNVSLAARWSFEDGQLVSESTQNISPTGPAVTEFHIAKPDGFPTGKYKVEVSANGKPAGAAQFTVTN